MSTPTKKIERSEVAPMPVNQVVLVLLVLAGLGAWIYQLTAGMAVTGLGQQVVWGLYIAAFFTAAGAGAGLLGLAAASEFTATVPRSSRKPLLALSLAAFVAAGVLITMDVGRPVQLWHLIAAFRFSSLLTWDFWLLAAAAIVAGVYLLTAQGQKSARVLSAAALITAVAVVAVEGWMLSQLAARPMWGSGLTVVAFLVGAATAGLGVAAFSLGERIRSWLASALLAGLILVAAEVLTGLLSGSPHIQAEMRLVVTGSAAPVFWLAVIAGELLPLGVLAAGGDVKIAGVLAFFGVLFEKVWMLAAGQAESWVNLPPGAYLPTAIELLAVAGALAFGIVLASSLRRGLKIEG